jgi:hypothetical protein
MKEIKYGIAVSNHSGIVKTPSMTKNIMKTRAVCFRFIKKRPPPGDGCPRRGSALWQAARDMQIGSLRLNSM